MFSSVVIVGSESDRVKDGQIVPESRLWPFLRFLKNHGVSQAHALVGDAFNAGNFPISDCLIVMDAPSEIEPRKKFVEEIKRIYKEKNLPILSGSQKNIEKEFIKMAFGDSFDLLKNDNIQMATKCTFILARFFKKSEVFSSIHFRDKVKNLTGVEIKSANCAATFNNFVKRKILKNLGKGKYYFLGLDIRSFQKLKNLGFDVTDDMCFEDDLKPQITPVSKPKSGGLPPEDLSKVIDSLKVYLHEEVQRILITTKMNERLLRIAPNDLKRAEAVLDLFVSQSKVE